MLAICLYTTILAREVDFSKMKKDGLKISKLRTSGGGGGGGVRDLGHLRTRGGGSKSGQILRTSFMYGPLVCFQKVERFKTS